MALVAEHMMSLPNLYPEVIEISLTTQPPQ
jgi:hypothetical protein